MSIRSTLFASVLTFALILFAYAAHAGQYTLAPGAQAYIDVSMQGSYTTITVVNTGSAPAVVEFDAPLNRRVEVAPGQRNEYYGSIRTRGSLLVRNSGQSTVTVTSSYQDRAPSP